MEVTAMKLGVGVPVSGSWATPENQIEIVRRAESLGYATAWTFQRLLYALEPKDEYAAAPEPKWPPTFESVVDPLVTLSFLAGHTERIRLGTAVVNVPFYPPVLLARQAATLDLVSRGRLTLGLGLGWSRDEYEAVGVPFRRRGARAEEFIRVLTAALEDDELEHHGEMYAVPRSRIDPKPAQRPRPPILLGGTSETALERVGRTADGWISGNAAHPDRIAFAIDRIRDSARRAGRDPDKLMFVVRGSIRLSREPLDGERPAFWGNVDQVRQDVERISKLGLTELFLELNFDPKIGSPYADAERSMDVARTVLEGLAPRPEI
jgi:probable F420-dependent oxidoreductase